MKPNELKLVADHMGHNLDIHTNIYKMQSSILEKSKVARVLLAVENGMLNKWKGQTLDQISIDGMEV